MIVRQLAAVILLLLSAWVSGAAAQSPFAQVTRGHELSFPADHTSHDRFRTEWWYLTASLHSQDGTTYGAQFTLFRHSFLVAGQPRPVFFAHAALSTPERFFYGERYARGDMGTGGVYPDPWLAFLDHWQLQGTGKSPLPGTLSVAESDFGFDLKLSESPYFLQGDNGYSQKDTGGLFASYYYNAPFIEVAGTIRHDGQSIPVTGHAWLDREWSSTVFADTSLGWDWLAMQVSSDTALLVYRVRSRAGHDFYGSIMTASGQQRELSPGDFTWEPRKWAEFGGTEYPIVWQLDVPSAGIALTVTPINENQFLPTTTQYWEGAVVTHGSHKARGYLELYGYK